MLASCTACRTLPLALLSVVAYAHLHRVAGDSGSPVAWYDEETGRQTVVGVIILGSEEPSHDQRCGAVGRHSVRWVAACFVVL